MIFRFARRPLLAALAAAGPFAGDTRTWSQSEYADFEKGNVKNLSLRSDGLVTLAPRVARNVRHVAALSVGAGARFQGQSLRGRRVRRQALPHSARTAKANCWRNSDGLAVQAIAIDSKDRVYAATSPDGKVYRIAGNGKPEVFFDPKTKYIWALAFDAAGDLYVATGDQGEIFRVTPDGKGKLFFKTDETHVRSMAFDAKGNLIVGTEPGGLVLRVSPEGEGFVLYQMPKREMTAVAVRARWRDLRGRRG